MIALAGFFTMVGLIWIATAIENGLYAIARTIRDKR